MLTRGAGSGYAYPATRRIALLAVAYLVARTASAQPLPSEREWQPAPQVFAHSQTTLRLFQRALLPGPNGALVRADTLVPIYEYWSLSGTGVVTPVSAEPASFELSGWVDATLGERRYEQPISGDVTAAWFRQPAGAFVITLGRQASFGGAARYVRFDGADVTWGTPRVGHAFYADVELYAGYTVLPRWDARPGYHQLGSAADTLIRDGTTLPEADRSGHSLHGGRAQVEFASRAAAGVSFHEQREEARLQRRNLGFDLTVTPLEALTLTSDLVLDTEQFAVVDASAWLDVEASERWWGTLSFLHVNPQLYLSRQSVFSVFDTSGFDEVGLELSHLPLPSTSLTARGFLEWFARGRMGTRAELQLRMDVDRAAMTRLGMTYARVVVPEGGYHSVRNSIRRRLWAPLSATAEAYLYWYDRTVASRRSATVFAANLEWAWSHRVRLLWGASLAQTPYAAGDLQTLLRLSYDAALSGGRP